MLFRSEGMSSWLKSEKWHLPCCHSCVFTVTVQAGILIEVSWPSVDDRHVDLHSRKTCLGLSKYKGPGLTSCELIPQPAFVVSFLPQPGAAHLPLHHFHPSIVYRPPVSFSTFFTPLVLQLCTMMSRVVVFFFAFLGLFASSLIHAGKLSTTNAAILRPRAHLYFAIPSTGSRDRCPPNR